MATRPFLKWAGGKFRLLASILPELPAGNRLVEPFAGSAALYLNAPFSQALVCDINADLINLYQELQRSGEPFIHHCSEYFTEENNTPERYYALRDAFNTSHEPSLRAVLLLYLNRHGFNGLVRYNSKGIFNTPFGKYKKPYFPRDEMHAFLRKNQQTCTEFVCQDFRQVFSSLRPGDVVYCDPPYVPLSRTANFTNYSGAHFTDADQKDLATLATAARDHGIPVILSNHDTEVTRRLYAAARLKRFTARRTISCRGEARHAVPELLALYH